MSADSETSGMYDRHITETKFWNELMHDVFGPRQGGAIIFVDAENSRKGVAKTSGAVAIGRLIARAFRYEFKKEDTTLSGVSYLRRYQDHPGKDQPSVLVIDEFVGAGSGDARRAMSTQNLDFGSAWQLLRSKRVITLATLPDWSEADPRLQKFADYRIWCRERPIGHFQPYKIVTPFNGSGSGGPRLKGLTYGQKPPRIKFPNMDAENDPIYKHLTKKKDELIHSDVWDADALKNDEEGEEEQLSEEEIERRQLTKVAIRLYKPWDENKSKSYEEVADAIDNKSDSWVGNRIREWKNGKHRDLVPDPRKNS